MLTANCVEGQPFISNFATNTQEMDTLFLRLHISHAPGMRRFFDWDSPVSSEAAIVVQISGCIKKAAPKIKMDGVVDKELLRNRGSSQSAPSAHYGQI